MNGSYRRRSILVQNTLEKGKYSVCIYFKFTFPIVSGDILTAFVFWRGAVRELTETHHG